MDALPGLDTVRQARPDAPETADGRRDEVRLWLRLLTCTTTIETEVRRRLRERFGITLPRFDVMAQLERAPGGLTLSELSRRMMVSNGNLTGLVERLVQSGHVERRPSPDDRRAQVVTLTKAGRAAFAAMAREHEGWIAAMFADLGPSGVEDLMSALGRTKRSVRRALGETPR